MSRKVITVDSYTNDFLSVFAKLFAGFLLVFLVILLVGVPALAYFSATHTADVWNRCHPSTPITTTEAFFTATEITICETGVLENK